MSTAGPNNPTSLAKQLDQHGFAIARHVIDERAVATLIDAIASLAVAADVGPKVASTYGVRHLCQLVPAVAAIAKLGPVRSLVEPILGTRATVVRSLLFDKTPDANWKVPWHQDLTIAVKERREVAGFGPWSVKAGVPHVQPPLSVLERMLTLRLHLDDCGQDNGALRIVPGSHRFGFLPLDRAQRLRQEQGDVTCIVSRRDAVLMRPLILHASSPARLPSHRRVVHLEFAAEQLPEGLNWYG
jgi:ectoine hydroxylase-related dioxygenase (phytanoyl-CoA dioxygenase family)